MFLTVVETRNFSEAARTLGVSTSAVSAAVLRLEQKLAVRLLNRTTRRVSPTVEGVELYRRWKQIIADVEQAEISVNRSARQPSGRLRIGMPSALGRTWVIPRLPEFVRAYPSVSVEIVIGDFLAASSREGLDAAIQLGELPSSRLIVHKLASVDYIVCAAPAYLAERGMPHRPSDLKDHVCIAYRRPRNGHIRDWQFARGKSLETVAPGGSMILNSGEALISAAIAGLGLIQVAEYYAKPSIDDGSLVEVLADYKTGSSDISVVFHGRQRMAPRLSVFIDFLVKIFDHPTWHSKR